MKKAIAVAALLGLSGCISIEMPGVVPDTVKATKDIYKEAMGGNRSEVSHSYVGKDNQTVAEIKRGCETEAARKLHEIAQKEIPYVVIQNEIATISNKTVANCKVTAAK